MMTSPGEVVIFQPAGSEVARTKKGKKGLIGLFTGEVMKKSGGKADPKIVQQLLQESLQKK